MDSAEQLALRHGTWFVAEPTWLADTRPTVYLDTSIPSYLTARLCGDTLRARRQLLTREWWGSHRENYALCVSERVLSEAGAGDSVAAQERLQALKEIHEIDATDDARLLMTQLVGDGLLPERARADAEHIAVAAVHSIRFLLTWNYKHLANATISGNIVRACESMGWICPEICTPEKLMRGFKA
jgi:hypothetical protein